jgi:hypothetical protein
MHLHFFGRRNCRHAGVPSGFGDLRESEGDVDHQHVGLGGTLLFKFDLQIENVGGPTLSDGNWSRYDPNTWQTICRLPQ